MDGEVGIRVGDIFKFCWVEEVTITELLVEVVTFFLLGVSATLPATTKFE